MTWFKIHAKEWLTKSISGDPAGMQAVFTKLLALAALRDYGEWGKIHIPSTDMGYSDEQLEGLMKLTPEQWAEGKAYHIDSARIILRAGNLIEIVNWKEYQSEYQRQKPQRDQQKAKEQVAPAPKRPRKKADNTLFTQFWAAYPKKQARGAAERAFAKIKPSQELLDTMLAAIEQAKGSKDWQKEGGQFIPMPATWLNAKRWEDEQTAIATRHSHDRRPADYTKPEEI